MVFLKSMIKWTLVLGLLMALYVWFVNMHTMEMSTRQKVLRAFYPVLTGMQNLFGSKAGKTAEPSAEPPVSVYTLNLDMIDGSRQNMAQWKGKKILLVNTASDCGYTAQYENLQQLSSRYPDQLVVIGFPANDFKEQEKGDNQEILAFCQRNYGVQFPLSAKTSVVKGPLQHPVFAWLSDEKQNGWNSEAPVWNFSKYLLDEQGRLVGVFGPAVDPMGKEIKNLIEKTSP
jgi:glutathione peroxidase